MSKMEAGERDMPLRDHFRPPLTSIASWEALHGGWPMVIVQHLKKQLPSGFVAAPRVQLGAHFEIDVAAYEHGGHTPAFGVTDNGGGLAVWAPPAPNLVIETESPDEDKYEVRIYDVTRDRHLVAAIELVSPANKDRPSSRNAFVAKCSALMRQGVAVSIVDLVTSHRSNLFAELMVFIGDAKRIPEAVSEAEQAAIYAVSCRWTPKGDHAVVESWSHQLLIGQRLPTLPLWLTETLSIALDLEKSYEQACEDLSIP
jgi:hypothetical protein